MSFDELKRKNIRNSLANDEVDEFINAPHGEEQSIVDRMERPYGDEDFEPDDDF